MDVMGRNVHQRGGETFEKKCAKECVHICIREKILPGISRCKETRRNMSYHECPMVALLGCHPIVNQTKELLSHTYD